MSTDIGKDLFGMYPELKDPFFSQIRPESTPYMTEQSDSPRFTSDKLTDIYKQPVQQSSPGLLEKLQNYMRSATTYKKGGKVQMPDEYKKGGNSSLI